MRDALSECGWDREKYLVHLCRYIHLNPVKAKLVSLPGGWAYSNYLEWIGQRAGILKDETFIRERFPTTEAYRRFVADYQDEIQALEHVQKYIWD